MSKLLTMHSLGINRMVKLNSNISAYATFKANEKAQCRNIVPISTVQHTNIPFKADGHWDRVLKTFLPEVKREKDGYTNGIKTEIQEAINFVKEIMRQPHKFFNQK